MTTLKKFNLRIEYRSTLPEGSDSNRTIYLTIKTEVMRMAMEKAYEEACAFARNFERINSIQVIEIIKKGPGR